MSKEMNNSKLKLSSFQVVKSEELIGPDIHYMFINWVIAEFDLYLKSEDEVLKVHFPNGWFSIKSFISNDGNTKLEIKVEGKSKTACKKVANQLENVYNHVIYCHRQKYFVTSPNH